MIKGTALRPFLKWYGQRYDLTQLRSVSLELDEESRARFDFDDPCFGVLESSWYPSEPVRKVMERVLADHSPAERESLAREGAHAVMKSTLKGVYRVLFDTMMSPERYARHAQKLFSRFYNNGTMAKEVLAPNRHRSIISDWRAHDSFFCHLLLYTGEYVYGAMGCQNVRVRRTQCVSEGAPDCRFIMEWD
jgi:hypothetical protein